MYTPYVIVTPFAYWVQAEITQRLQSKECANKRHIHQSLAFIIDASD